MKKVLSLDVSSSIVGFALFEYDQAIVNFLEYGYFKPPNKKQSQDNLPLRLQKTIDNLNVIFDKFDPNEIVIEDYAKRFSAGKSKAQTILLLAVFNEVSDLTAYQKLNKKSFRYPVATIRSTLGKHFGIKIVSKDEVFPVIVEKFTKFKLQYNKNQNVHDFCYDEADAIALGAVHILKQTKGNLIWNI